MQVCSSRDAPATASPRRARPCTCAPTAIPWQSAHASCALMRQARASLGQRHPDQKPPSRDRHRTASRALLEIRVRAAPAGLCSHQWRQQLRAGPAVAGARHAQPQLMRQQVPVAAHRVGGKKRLQLAGECSRRVRAEVSVCISGKQWWPSGALGPTGLLWGHVAGGARSPSAQSRDCHGRDDLAASAPAALSEASAAAQRMPVGRARRAVCCVGKGARLGLTCCSAARCARCGFLARADPAGGLAHVWHVGAHV